MIAAGAPLTHQDHTELKPRNDREGFLLMISQLVQSCRNKLTQNDSNGADLDYTYLYLVCVRVLW